MFQKTFLNWPEFKERGQLSRSVVPFFSCI